MENKKTSINKFYFFTQLYIGLLPIPLILVFKIFILIYPDLITDVNVQLILTTLVMTLGPILVFIKNSEESFFKAVHFKAVSLKNIIYITLICIFIQPVMLFLSYIGMFFANNPVNEVVDNLIDAPYFYSLLTIAVMPAIFEELLMRGVVLKRYENLPLMKMALINGLFFGFMHINLQQFLYAALLGFIFVYIYKLTDSILSTIYAHFIINGSQITLAYLSQRVTVEGSDVSNVSAVGESTIIVIIFYLSILVFFASISYFIIKKFIKHNMKNKEIEQINAREENVKIIDGYFIGIIIVYACSIILMKILA